MNRQDIFCRKATIEDAPIIAQIHVETWQAAYKKLLPADLLASISVTQRMRMWERMINADSANARLFVAGWGSEIKGFAAAGPPRNGDKSAHSGEVNAIYVDESAWRSAIGYHLMQTACEFLRRQGRKQVMLWVLDDNKQAIRFYERFGFKRDESEQGVKLEQFDDVPVRELRYQLDLTE